MRNGVEKGRCRWDGGGNNEYEELEGKLKKNGE